MTLRATTEDDSTAEDLEYSMMKGFDSPWAL